MSEGADPRATIAAAMDQFRALPRAERYGRVSLWTMYYLGALIVPAIAAAARTGRAPPTAIDALTCTLDAGGHVVGFRPRHDISCVDYGFDELVTDHLAVLVADCARLSGFPTRVAWSNAAVMIDHAVNAARGIEGLCGRALGEAEALIASARHRPLARPVQHGVRRVCCLRYLLPDGILCPDICPRARRNHELP